MVFKNCRDLYVPTQKDIQDILLSEKKQVAEWFLQAYTMGVGGDRNWYMHLCKCLGKKVHKNLINW